MCKGGVEGAWLELEAERSGCNCCLEVGHHNYYVVVAVVVVVMLC